MWADDGPRIRSKSYSGVSDDYAVIILTELTADTLPGCLWARVLPAFLVELRWTAAIDASWGQESGFG